MQEELTICQLSDLRKVSEIIHEIVSSSRKNVVLLHGNLGTGKTSLVKDYLRLVTGSDLADSPTFSLVNDYQTNHGKIHHFDLYRLNSLEDIEDIGFWEYVESGNTCFIEWPEKIAELLPENQRINVDIKLNLEQCREFSISY
jgi:tRNA threonylcarbamoyladenosine biosynthesis protein TsaE